MYKSRIEEIMKTKSLIDEIMKKDNHTKIDVLLLKEYIITLETVLYSTYLSQRTFDDYIDTKFKAFEERQKWENS